MQKIILFLLLNCIATLSWSQGCIAPIHLSVEETGQITADISWAAGGSETQWEVKYGPAGFSLETEGISKSVDGLTNTILTDLSDATHYEFYVKAKCDGGEESGFAGPVKFTTDCIPGSDFIENFDTTGIGKVPICWTTLKVNSSDMFLDNYVIGNEFQFANKSDDSAELYLISPEVTNLDDADHRLRFLYKGNQNVTLEIGTISDISDATTFNVIETLSTSNEYEEYSVNFDQNSTDLHMAFKVIFTTMFSRAYLDNVSWEPIPDCFKPQDFSFEGATTTTADLSWVPGASEDQWEIKYGTPGFDPDSEGTSEVVNGVPEMTLNDLSVNTEYEAYIRSQCGNEAGNSIYTFPITFFTECESTNLPFTQDFEGVSTPEVPNCGTLENNGSGDNWKTVPNPGYGFTSSTVLAYWVDPYDNPANAWYFTQGVELEAETNYEIIYTYGNNSIDHTEKLKMSYGTSAMSSAMITELDNHTDVSDAEATTTSIFFTVPANDTYYFGFNAYSDANQYNLYIDDIQIDFGPICSPPNDISINTLTDTSCKIIWSPGGNESQWEVIYGGVGFNIDTEGETINIDSGIPQTTLNNLDPETEYEVYVRAICDADYKSDLIGPESFTTLITPPENNYLCNAISLALNDGCVDGPYTNVGAFPESDEPTGICLNSFQGTNTVWFSFVAPSNGHAMITTDFLETVFMTEMVVFEAPIDCEDFTTLGDEVGCASSGSEVELNNLNPDATYFVRVGGFNNNEGDFCIEVQTTMSSENHNFENFIYYPNPIQDQLILKAYEQIESVTVFNLLGQEVINAKPNTLQTQINVSNLQSGVYLMNVTVNGTQKSFRVIKK